MTDGHTQHAAIISPELTTLEAVTWCERARVDCILTGRDDDAVVFEMVREVIERATADGVRSFNTSSLQHLAASFGYGSAWTDEKRRERDALREHLRPWTLEMVRARRDADEYRPLSPLEVNAYADPVRAYLSSLGSDYSRAGMQQSLRLVYQLSGLSGEDDRAVALFWLHFNPGQFAAIRAGLIERGLKPATVNHALSAVRGVINQMWTLGYISKDTAERLCSIKSVNQNRDEPAGREISLAEMKRILERVAEDTADPVRAVSAVRDAALLSLLWSTGMRRHEIAALELDAVNFETGEVQIRHGKGNKFRTIYVAGNALEALRAWVTLRIERGVFGGPLFLSVNRWGQIRAGSKMTPESVYRIVIRRQQDAGVESLTTHDFRRTFVGNSLTSGVDILTVMGICGHSNVDTTARYDRRKHEQRKNAAALVFTPYVAS